MHSNYLHVYHTHVYLVMALCTLQKHTISHRTVGVSQYSVQAGDCDWVARVLHSSAFIKSVVTHGY